MKLHEALFQEPWQAYQVLRDYVDNWDDFHEWDLQPLTGSTLAAEDVNDAFQGLFIIAAHIISNSAAPQPCYLDLILPERIAEHHFVLVGKRIARQRGQRVLTGTVIPAIGVENFGNYKLFYAKENPSAGIDVLKRGMEEAHERGYLAYDLAFLLRDEKRYHEAIEALTVLLTEHPAPHLAPSIYQERARMYAAIGEADKADADKHQYALAFHKQFGHPPGPQDT